MKRKWMLGGMLVLVVGLLVAAVPAWAQDDAAEKMDVAEAAAKAEKEDADSASFLEVVGGSGPVGIILWSGLFVTSLAGIYLIIDSWVKISGKKIMPPELIDQVREAMEVGDLGKAMEYCRERPGVMSNILMAGFSNVEEGFDVIQDVINAVADLESEKLLQKVTYLSVVSNLAPMLGLLGTVQGMIFAFATLGTQTAGAAQQSMLAMNISQALFTTAAGLSVAVPAIAFYYFFRNKANSIILNMVITTIDLIKALRNVEVVNE